MVKWSASRICALNHSNRFFHGSGCFSCNERLREWSTIIGISQEGPSILFSISKFPFFYWIVGDIDDASPDIFLTCFKSMAIGHKDDTSLAGKLIECERIFGFNVSIEKRELCGTVCNQKGVSMIRHQTERQRSYSSFLGFYSVDGKIDQTIYLTVKQYVPVNSFLIAMRRDTGLKEVFHTLTQTFFQR